MSLSKCYDMLVTMSNYHHIPVTFSSCHIQVTI